MKRIDIYEWIADYVYDNSIVDGEELLIEFDGRNLCKAIVKLSGEEDEFVDFKIVTLR